MEERTPLTVTMVDLYLYFSYHENLKYVLVRLDNGIHSASLFLLQAVHIPAHNKMEQNYHSRYFREHDCQQQTSRECIWGAAVNLKAQCVDVQLTYQGHDVSE
eukprot:scpid102316/ scgid16949/ 